MLRGLKILLEFVVVVASSRNTCKMNLVLKPFVDITKAKAHSDVTLPLRLDITDAMTRSDATISRTGGIHKCPMSAHIPFDTY